MHLNRSFTDSSLTIYILWKFSHSFLPLLTAQHFLPVVFFFFFNLGVSLLFLLQKYGTDFNFKLQLHFNSDDALGLKSFHSCPFLPCWFQHGLHRHPRREGSISAEPPSCVILHYCVPGFLRCRLHWKNKCIANRQIPQPYFPLLYLLVHAWVFKLLISAAVFYVFFVDSVMS